MTVPLSYGPGRARGYCVHLGMLCLNSFPDELEYVKKNNVRSSEEAQPLAPHFPKENLKTLAGIRCLLF